MVHTSSIPDSALSTSERGFGFGDLSPPLSFLCKLIVFRSTTAKNNVSREG